MKSEKSGTTISTAEVTGITPFGVWLLVHEEEKFLPFEHFPSFRNATVAQICSVELPSRHHLTTYDVMHIYAHRTGNAIGVNRNMNHLSRRDTPLLLLIVKGS